MSEKVKKEADAGMAVKEICRKHGISDATYYNWRSKYGGMEASDLKRMKELESELSQYKRMYAELARENDAMRNLIAKMYGPPRVCKSRDWRGEPGSAQMYPACLWTLTILAMMEIRT
jgi:putative transposase